MISRWLPRSLSTALEMYLERIGFGLANVHSGNVMMRNIDEVCITDYENSVLGLQAMGMTPSKAQSKRAGVLAYGRILYEMASGCA